MWDGCPPRAADFTGYGADATAKENRMPWTITKDFIADANAPKPSNQNAVGMVGPRNATLTAEKIIDHPQGRKFRMKDDDGEMYYEGTMVIVPEDGDEGEFRPLSDFGGPNAGATSIEYQRADGLWELI